MAEGMAIASFASLEATIARLFTEAAMARTKRLRVVRVTGLIDKTVAIRATVSMANGKW
jgi:hypothetical protein